MTQALLWAIDDGLSKDLQTGQYGESRVCIGTW